MTFRYDPLFLVESLKLESKLPSCKNIRSRGYKLFFMLNLAETKIYPARRKVQVGKDQEKSNQKKIPTLKPEVGKYQTNNQVLIP